MDLQKLVSSRIEEGAELIVMDPLHEGREVPLGGKDSPVTLVIVSKDSARYRRALHAATRKGAKDPAAGGEDAEKESDLIEAKSVEVLASLIIGWKNIEWEGFPLDYSPGAAVELLQALPFLRPQVELFAASRSNFLGN